ncbi:MAG: DNA-processing protein DprA [Chloroflexota bacterium]
MSKVHWLALCTLPGVGGATVREVIQRFGRVEAVFDMPDEELLVVKRLAKVLPQLRAVSLDAVRVELGDMIDGGIHVLTWDDTEYPANLRPLRDAPPILYAQGTLLPQDEKAVAIIGSRQPSPPAVEWAATLGRELAARGLTIVSGLAVGIDTAAHQGALQAEGGRTLAVLGSGLNRIHPRQNTELAQAISERGALLSEQPPDEPVRKQSMMIRNRLISGLSRAVIVVEAQSTLNSGSLDTAKRAINQGRPLMAVPGSPGADALLLAGAIPIRPDALDFDYLCHLVGHGLGE